MPHDAGSRPLPSGPLVTGEAVSLDLQVAALPSRAVARIVDGLAQVVLLLALGLLAGFAAGGASEAVGAAVGILVLVLVLLVYPIVQETLLRGRTLGKMAVGLRVVRDDGGPIAFRQALVRGLAVLVDLPTLFTVSVVCMLLHPRSKRLGDLLAGTLVVQERVATAGGAVAVMPPPLEAWARTLDLSRLSDDLALQARSFVSRAADLRPEAREDLGGRLVSAVQAATAPAPPPGTPGWAYLSAVLAERRRRDGERYAAPAAHAAPAYAAPAPVPPGPVPPGPVPPAPTPPGPVPPGPVPPGPPEAGPAADPPPPDREPPPPGPFALPS